MKKPQNRPWKVLQSEYLAQKPWYTVRHERMQLPNGRVIPDYYLYEYPDWINVIARTAEGDFVMVSQYRPGIADTCYEIVAGVMETGETPLEAARRELLEESGFGGGSWRELMTLSANPATQTNWTYSFVAEGVERASVQHLDATEDIDIHLLTVAEVRELLVTGAIKQALHAAPLWRYFAENHLL